MAEDRSIRKNGKFIGSRPGPGKKSPEPPRGFKALFSKGKESIETDLGASLEEKGRTFHRKQWEAFLAKTSLGKPSQSLENASYLDANGILFVYTDSDMLPEPGEPIFNEGQQESITALLKLKVVKTVRNNDGANETYYTIPGFNDDKDNQLSLRETVNAGTRAVPQVTVGLMDAMGNFLSYPRQGDTKALIGAHIADKSILATATRGIIESSEYEFHHDLDTKEIALIKILAKTGWYHKDLLS